MGSNIRSTLPTLARDLQSKWASRQHLRAKDMEHPPTAVIGESTSLISLTRNCSNLQAAPVAEFPMSDKKTLEMTDQTITRAQNIAHLAKG